MFHIKLKEMQIQVSEETGTTVMKDSEATSKAVEQAVVSGASNVKHLELLAKLTAENEQLKALINTENTSKAVEQLVVQDHELLAKLTAENEQLKALITRESSMDTQKVYVKVSSNENGESMKHAQKEEMKMSVVDEVSTINNDNEKLKVCNLLSKYPIMDWCILFCHSQLGVILKLNDKWWWDRNEHD